MGTILEEEESGHIVQWVFQASRKKRGAENQESDILDTIYAESSLYGRPGLDVREKYKPCEENVKRLAWWLRKSLDRDGEWVDGEL